MQLCTRSAVILSSFPCVRHWDTMVNSIATEHRKDRHRSNYTEIVEHHSIDLLLSTHFLGYNGLFTYMASREVI